MNNWYAVFTYPRIERSIYKDLGSRGIEAFLPLQKVIRQWSDRKKKIYVPLFPNYLFVSTSPNKFQSILNVRGVVKFVSIDKEPSVVPPKEIEKIKRLLSSEPKIANVVFDQGASVKVTGGPLKDLNGTVISFQGRYRLAVEIAILNRIVLVDLSPSDIETTVNQNRKNT